MTKRPPSPVRRSDSLFTPVPVRPRHDGWTPERQVAFIEALAATGCVEEAAKVIGMSRESAYVLRGRSGADSFRQAWDLALDHAISRLADVALGRAINGVATPIFYKGQQVGERRRYDEKLTMFLLRYRDPHRYGVWRDRWAHRAAVDKPRRLARALRGVAADAALLQEGRLPPERDPNWLDSDADIDAGYPVPPPVSAFRDDPDADMV